MKCCNTPKFVFPISSPPPEVPAICRMGRVHRALHSSVGISLYLCTFCEQKICGGCSSFLLWYALPSVQFGASLQIKFLPCFCFGRYSTGRNCFACAQFFSAYLPVHDRRHCAMMTCVPCVTGGMRLGKAGELQSLEYA